MSTASTPDSDPRSDHVAAAEERLRKINTFTISLLQQNTLQDLLASMVENVANLLGYEDCVIYLRHGDTLKQTAGFPAVQKDFQLELGEGIVGGVAQSGKPRIVPDTRQEPSYVRDNFGGLSELAVPIFYEGEVLGVLDTESQRVDAYGQPELELLQAIANIAASRIASALADKERSELLAQLSSKNTELENFIYTVSHDLKSPLITIRGFLGLLEKDLEAGETERVQRDIERIQGATQNMGDLLNDLLALSRIGRMFNPSIELPLGELIQETVSHHALSIRDRGIKVEIAPRFPTVFGDRERILQALEHLVDNAIKFIGDGEQPTIEIGHRDDRDHIVFFVRDNGIGIAPEHHERIFGLFEQLGQDTPGTGIGLALTQRIVETHKGRLWIESDGEGAGSAFFIALPR
ncbi:MAG: GAF domain-containing sensor histidine kinase [Acidobacteriota bacterium]